MKTIVHIGMPKTGTTALQKSLHGSAAYLAQRGLLYPTNPPGSRAYNHRLLVAQVVSFDRLPRGLKNWSYLTKDNVADRLEEFFDHLRRQIERQRPAGVILSTEGLFRPLPTGRHETLRQVFGASGEPRFVAYLRRPSEHYLSNLQQTLKASAIVSPPKPSGYRKILESYDACFGPQAVSARLFHRDHLENGDTVADFCKHHLAEFGVDPAKLHVVGSANETLSAESMDILRRYRAAFHAERHNVFTRDTQALRVTLARIDRAHGAPRPRLRPGLAEAIDLASHDCLWIRDRFGVVFPGLDYDRLAAAATAPAPDFAREDSLDAVVVIDRDLRARVLDDLARSRWVSEDAARKAWLSDLLGASRGGGRPVS
jgi:hypothetical protein